MERDVERFLVDRVKAKGGLCLKFSPMGVDGFPDRIALMPGGTVVFVELKDKGKKPRPLQLYCHRRLRDLGFRVEVVDTKEGVEALMEDIWSSYRTSTRSTQ